jgi:hypothetical protein
MEPRREDGLRSEARSANRWWMRLEIELELELELVVVLDCRDSHKAFGRSILAQKQRSQRDQADFLATQLFSALMLASPLRPSSLRDLCVLLCRSPSCDSRTSEAPPLAMCSFRAPGPLGDRTLPTQA